MCIAHVVFVVPKPTFILFFCHFCTESTGLGLVLVLGIGLGDRVRVKLLVERLFEWKGERKFAALL